MAFRFTLPLSEIRNTARIESFSYAPRTQTLEVTYSLGDDSGGTYVEKSRHQIFVPDLPAAGVTRLNETVTRIFNYLVARGIIPAGTEV
jgi:hypothetical protein